MKPRIGFGFLASVALAVAAGSPMSAQSFSCSIGDRPSCLGYGETVCSSQGMCVRDDAIVFSRNTCDYEGFTCKSNLTNLGGDYDGLVTRFNRLLSDKETLLNDYNRLVNDYNDLLETSQRLESSLEALKRCVNRASTISDAQACRF